LKPKFIETARPIKVTTPEGELSLTIQLEMESGKDRRVYKVIDQRGRYYAYKHAKKRSVRKEVERTEAVKKLGLPHAAMIAYGVDYMLRPWIEGSRGDDWLKAWESFGSPLNVDATNDLFLLLDSCARKGMYVGKLDPEDVVFSAGRWTIVDSGGVKEMPPKEAADRYFWKMLERWGAKLDRHREAFPKLFQLLSPLGKDYPVEEPLPLPPEELVPIPRSVSQQPDRAAWEHEDDDSSGEIDDPDEEDSPDSAPPSSGDVNDEDSDEDEDDVSDEPIDPNDPQYGGGGGILPGSGGIG